MRTILVVVVHELGEQHGQMPLVENDDVVWALVAKGPNNPLREILEDEVEAGTTGTNEGARGCSGRPTTAAEEYQPASVAIGS